MRSALAPLSATKLWTRFRSSRALRNGALAAALLLTFVALARGVTNHLAPKSATALAKSHTMLHAADLVDHTVIAFYYPWYGAPREDGRWLHWRHEILDGSKRVIEPPGDIGANFWPQLGLYSSRDRAAVRVHMEMLRAARIGTLCASWWGRSESDSQGAHTDATLELLLDEALRAGLKLAFHLEPYQNRTAASVAQDIRYLEKRYFSHDAVLRLHGRALVFVYDSYTIAAKSWAALFSTELRVRPWMIGLVVERASMAALDGAGFDGWYSYFATDGFTFGSTWSNWPEIDSFAKARGKMFIPAVGPGYADLKIRPWNGCNQRARANGAYYDSAWRAALPLNSSPLLSITSFNEWHEGTHIEPSVPRAGFLDFQPLAPDHYLVQTALWVAQRRANRTALPSPAAQASSPPVRAQLSSIDPDRRR